MTILTRPGEDRELSPFTGWSRAHWEWAADLLLAGVRPYASPRNAYLNLPGVASSHGPVMDGLEGFSRTFLLAAFRLAGAGGDAPGELTARYAEGVAAGVEPGGAESWPRVTRRAHSIVEAAAVAVSLFETRRWIWDRLGDSTREQAASWLGQVRGRRCYPNNWRLFPLVVHGFLRAVGAPHRRSEIDASLEWLERLHRGGGWYSDGPGHRYDHYGAWALHLYPALWLRMGELDDPAAARSIRERLAHYLDDYRHLFGADGAPLFHGRSLTYRFAVVAPFWAATLAGCSPLTPGETRRLASGALRHFMESGALNRALLTRGWHGAFRNMVQDYSGPASPYWASKAFLGLLLPPDHVAWAAREEPLPVERGDFVRAMWPAGFLAQGTRADGIVRVTSHRSTTRPPWSERVRRVGRRPEMDAHYSKLSYSTRTAPNTAYDAAPAGPDCTVSLVDHDHWGEQRARLRGLGAEDRFAASVHRARKSFGPMPGRRARIETASIALSTFELRVHRISTGTACTVRDAGFSIAAADPPGGTVGRAWSLVRRTDGLASVCIGILGLEPADPHRAKGLNAFGDHSASPVLVGRHPGGARVYASLVALSGEPLDPDELAGEVRELTVDRQTVVVTLRGGEGILLQLGRVRAIDRVLHGQRVRGRVRFARVSPGEPSLVIGEEGERIR